MHIFWNFIRLKKLARAYYFKKILKVSAIMTFCNKLDRFARRKILFSLIEPKEMFEKGMK